MDHLFSINLTGNDAAVILKPNIVGLLWMLHSFILILESVPIHGKKVVYGVGGAERLVIDAAVGLLERGHKVTIYTSHCDKNHCFDEARDGREIVVPAHLRDAKCPSSWRYNCSRARFWKVCNSMCHLATTAPIIDFTLCQSYSFTPSINSRSAIDIHPYPPYAVSNSFLLPFP